MATFKKILQHLVKIGVLSVQGTSRWASPTFVVPNKYGRVRLISNLRALNKVVKRHQYPLPIISNVLKKQKGCDFQTKLVISTQHYTIEIENSLNIYVQLSLHLGSLSTMSTYGIKMFSHFSQEVMLFNTPTRVGKRFLPFKTILTGLMSSFQRSIKLRKRFPTRFRMKESVREKVAFRRELYHFSVNGFRILGELTIVIC